MPKIRDFFYRLAGGGSRGVVQPRDACSHQDQIMEVTPSADGCEECLAMGDEWVHLRLCLTCGHVGCCDNSKNKHATAHFHTTGHPIIQSFEPNETWRWCFVDKVMV